MVLQDSDLVLSTVIVAPTSTSAGPATYRPEIDVQGIKTRVLVEQMRACDFNRFGALVGHVRFDEMHEIEGAMRLILDL